MRKHSLIKILSLLTLLVLCPLTAAAEENENRTVHDSLFNEEQQTDDEGQQPSQEEDSHEVAGFPGKILFFRYH